jgi:hypothetical protein
MILTTECALIDIKEENAGEDFNGWRYARNDVKSKKLYKIRFNNRTDFLIILYTNNL